MLAVRLAFAAVLVALTSSSANAEAALLQVNTFSDSVANDANCSLREAVTAANSNTSFNGCVSGGGSDTIQLGAGEYTIGGADGDDGNANGDLDINLTGGPLTIDGAGTLNPNTTRISRTGPATDRLLHFMNAGNATLQDLVLNAGGVSGATEGGAGIKVEGGSDFTLQRARITNGTVTDAGGGGILATGGGVLSLIDSRIDNNVANGTGSGVQGAGIDRVGGQLILTRTTIDHNEILAANDATDNDPVHGGGIHIGPGATTTITDSGIFENGVGTSDPADIPTGGGIALEGAGANSLVRRTLISDNSLTGGNYRQGAGVDWMTTSNTDAVQFLNSTFDSNDAGVASSFGGAIHAYGGVIAFEHVTATGDMGQTRGIHYDGDMGLGGFFRVASSILAEGGTECAGSGLLFTSGGYNIEEDPDASGDCGFFTQPGDMVQPAAAIGLSPLADNGGPTQTRSLTASSPAVDHVPPGSCLGAPDNTDQRGRARPHGAGCDTGAYELGDVDGDGVLDTADNCPTQIGPASNGGCPQPVIASPPPPPPSSPVAQILTSPPVTTAKKCKRKKTRSGSSAKKRKCRKKRK